MHSTARLRAESPSFTIYPPSAFFSETNPVLADTDFCFAHQLIQQHLQPTWSRADAVNEKITLQPQSNGGLFV